MNSKSMSKGSGGKVLTISVAAYNVGDYIERCLKSLVVDSKRMKKIEVLIENDDSTDNTAEIAEKFVKKYPSTFKLINKKNGGYGSTVNNSIKLATGKYFKILDGDDEFNTKNLTDFIDILEKIDTDAVVSPCVRTFVPDATRTDMEEYPFPKSISGEKNIEILISPECKKNFYKMHTAAYKTEIYKNNHIILPEHILYTDVIAAYVPLLYSNTVYIFNKPIYMYHIGREGQSVSIEKRIAHTEDRVIGAEEVLKYAKNSGLSPVFDMYTGISCAGVIADHLLLCGVSARNHRKIINYDNHVKEINEDVWKNMCFYKTIKVLRKARFSWIVYVALHFERKIKLGRIS